VKNKAVPDPFYGLGNEVIIDIADSGREYYTFWFFTTFQCKLVCNTSLPVRVNYELKLQFGLYTGIYLDFRFSPKVFHSIFYIL
jgi:hypothetical protein